MEQPAVTWGLRVWTGGVLLVGLQVLITEQASLALGVIALGGLLTAWWTASEPAAVLSRLEAHGGARGRWALGATVVTLFVVMGTGVGFSGVQRSAMVAFLVSLGGLLAVYGNGPEVDSEEST